MQAISEKSSFPELDEKSLLKIFPDGSSSLIFE
jgi:hypothetical protein